MKIYKNKNFKLFNPIFLSFLFIFILIQVFPISLSAWGSYVHKLINKYAVDNLPQNMIDDNSGNAFGDWRDYLEAHASDPDNAKDSDPNEDVRHYINIDKNLTTYPYPFTNVPRDKTLYLQKFYRSSGVAPWEGWQDCYNRLVNAFKDKNFELAYKEAAWLGHYVADIYQPMHTTINFNGQLSTDDRNYGIHSRYETSLPYRFVTTVYTMKNSAEKLTNIVEECFTAIKESWLISLKALESDLLAQDKSGNLINTTYYNEFWRLTGEDVQERIDTAARTLASLWYSAYVEAGSPSFAPNAVMWVFY